MARSCSQYEIREIRKRYTQLAIYSRLNFDNRHFGPRISPSEPIDQLLVGRKIMKRSKALFSRQRRREPVKGVLAGLLGGLVGTIVMTQFQHAWTKVSTALKNNNQSQQNQRQTKEDDQQQDQPEKEDPTMKAAGKIASVAGRQLSHEQRKKLGPVVHYSFGTLQGALYGGATELTETSGGLLPGLLFGASLFVVADEITVPALGLSSKPTESPLSSHLYGLASHLVYGVSTEIARRGLRAAF